jgi:uncharacterized membrane protein YkoI
MMLSYCAYILLTQVADEDKDHEDEDKGDEDEAGIPGQIDDGAELLGQSSISLEEVISAAQEAARGELGEVDLEKHEGKLVFI